MHENGASFLHAPPPPFLYKHGASPSLHTPGYHTKRLPLSRPMDSTLVLALCVWKPRGKFTLSPLFSSLKARKLCRNSQPLHQHGGYSAKALAKFGLHSINDAVAWRTLLQHSLFFSHGAEALPKFSLSTLYCTIHALHNRSNYAILVLHYHH